MVVEDLLASIVADVAVPRLLAKTQEVDIEVLGPFGPAVSQEVLGEHGAPDITSSEQECGISFASQSFHLD